ncbi:MAG: hypothetical protein GY768_16435, partial [Planctomycetaceae bacterium]|nr:hypothetical protein [Planctomycetaceae bacterium]
HYLLELYEHLQGMDLLPQVAESRMCEKGPIAVEMRRLIDEARNTGLFLGHRMVVEGGDPIQPDPWGGPSAAATWYQRPRGSPWAEPPAFTLVTIRGYRFADSSIHRQMNTLRDQTIQSLQEVLQESFNEEEIRRLL